MVIVQVCLGTWLHFKHKMKGFQLIELHLAKGIIMHYYRSVMGIIVRGMAEFIKN